MDPSYAMFEQQEFPSRKIMGEPSKEKEQSLQYSPSLPSSPRDSPRTPSDHKKRKRGRPPLEKDSRSCSNCGTGETPEWRKGPLGPHTLCNACGLQWMKAQKRDNEATRKMEEARKKHSVMRVVNRPGASSREMQGEATPRYSTHSMDMMGDNSNGGGEVSRYSPEMDTLPPDAISPTMSPMQSISSTPVSMDTLNTIKAMQTLSALSQMNQMNHINTLNHLNILSMNNNPSMNNTSNMNITPNNDPSFSSPHYHTVINHYNTNLNAYHNNNNPYSLSDLGTPMARFPPLNPQQIFLPLAYNSVNPPPPQSSSSYSPYLQSQQPQLSVKDYTSSLSMHPPPTQQQQQYNPYLSLHTPHSHMHPSYSHSSSSSSSLLHPTHNLIPSPTIQHHDDAPYHEDDDSSITGGGQM